MNGIDTLLFGIQNKDRRSLAKAITVIESTTPSDKEISTELLRRLPASLTTQRIAFSGPPGAGKSTLIDQFGTYLTSQGKTVAVLAIDPSAPLDQTFHGGSLLGDKTRMETLSKNPMAFVRPSPSKSGVLGGAATTTADAIRILEAASYDIILVETVGIGQSDIDATFLTDLTILVLPPAVGDALQGMKRGIVEFSDIIVVNKDDGDLSSDAERTTQEYAHATKGLDKMVLKCSALHQKGFEELLQAIQDFFNKNGDLLPKKRQEQESHQFIRRLALEWPRILRETPVLQALIQENTDKIAVNGQSARESCEFFYKTLISLLTKGQK